MSKEKEPLPRALRPYVTHGVQLTHRGGDHEATGECPWCGKHKLYVNPTDGRWDCKSCDGKGGNVYGFFRKLWDAARQATPNGEYDALAQDRGLVEPETLLAWGLTINPLNGEWLIPGHAPDGRLNHLYRYVPLKGDDGTVRNRMVATADVTADRNSQTGHQLLGYPAWGNKGTVYVCEGFWDGAALWEALRHAKVTDDGLAYTANPAVSLASDADVLAVPSCTVWRKEWCELLAGKRVVLCYDNDHPRLNPKTRVVTPPPGLEGMRRAAGVLAAWPQPPQDVSYLAWGTEGDGYSEDLPAGYDVRDMLQSEGHEWPQRVRALARLLALIKPIPAGWVAGRSSSAVSSGSVELEPLECASWPALLNGWRKAMKWTPGLEKALACMLACAASTKTGGDQLWLQVISPASTGKSTLCEALTANRSYVKGVSTLRGFHSGFKTDKDGEEDHSLIANVDGKTLVVKDGDTLLRSPDRERILSEARDVYDRTSRAHYRHGMDRQYENISMTLILCGTGAMKELDSSDLGARFLHCIIMDGVDAELEDEVLDRVFIKAERSAATSVEDMGGGDSPQMTEAKRLTMGYLNHLRDHNRAAVLAEEILGKWTPEGRALMKALAKFVAFLRARPSRKQQEVAERELAARLLGQLVRMAMFLAVVMQRKEIDAVVLAAVRAVALDTARGVTLHVAHALYRERTAGMATEGLGLVVNMDKKDLEPLMQFLAKIGMVEKFRYTVPGLPQRVGQQRWKLTGVMQGLYEAVVPTLPNGGA